MCSEELEQQNFSFKCNFIHTMNMFHTLKVHTLHLCLLMHGSLSCWIIAWLTVFNVLIDTVAFPNMVSM